MNHFPYRFDSLYILDHPYAHVAKTACFLQELKKKKKVNGHSIADGRCRWESYTICVGWRDVAYDTGPVGCNQLILNGIPFSSGHSRQAHQPTTRLSTVKQMFFSYGPFDCHVCFMAGLVRFSYVWGSALCVCLWTSLKWGRNRVKEVLNSVREQKDGCSGESWPWDISLGVKVIGLV